MRAYHSPMTRGLPVPSTVTSLPEGLEDGEHDEVASLPDGLEVGEHDEIAGFAEVLHDVHLLELGQLLGPRVHTLQTYPPVLHLAKLCRLYRNTVPIHCFADEEE